MPRKFSNKELIFSIATLTVSSGCNKHIVNQHVYKSMIYISVFVTREHNTMKMMLT